MIDGVNISHECLSMATRNMRFDSTIEESQLPTKKLWRGLSKDVENTGSTARDHLANERTFLAWLRTSTAFIAFGIIIIKFFQSNGGSVLGTIVIFLGGALMPYAGRRYHDVQVALEKGHFIINTGGAIVVTIISVAVAVCSFVAVIASLYF